MTSLLGSTNAPPVIFLLVSLTLCVFKLLGFLALFLTSTFEVLERLENVLLLFLVWWAIRIRMFTMGKKQVPARIA